MTKDETQDRLEALGELLRHAEQRNTDLERRIRDQEGFIREMLRIQGELAVGLKGNGHAPATH